MLDANRCYAILELKPGATHEDIKRSYKELVQVWHPDRFAYNPQLQQKAQEKLKEINEAHKFLMQYSQPPTNQVNHQARHSQQSSSIQQHYQEAQNTNVKGSQRTDSELQGCLIYMALIIIAIAILLLIKFPGPTIMVVCSVIYAISQTSSKK